MRRSLDRITKDISCLSSDGIAATLVSTAGHHCDVWQSIGTLVRNGERIPLDFVIKVHCGPCSLAETRIYHRQYQTLKNALGSIIPIARFIATQVDGAVSLVVLAETVTRWFNIANPTNEDEAVPLLRKMPKARAQLTRFLAATRHWQTADEPRVIDLYGIDNLVLDKSYNIKYIDSFAVFFNLDLLHVIDSVDDDLKTRIDISLQRRDYLAYILRQAGVRDSEVLTL